jgi:hypothetical protein
MSDELTPVQRARIYRMLSEMDEETREKIFEADRILEKATEGMQSHKREEFLRNLFHNVQEFKARAKGAHPSPDKMQ